MRGIELRSLWLLLFLPVAFFTAFFILPLAVVLLASFDNADGNLTLANYAKVLADQYHWDVTATTFRIAIMSTLITLLLGYPLAWYIVRVIRVPAWRRICIILVIVPLFTSNIVRSFGWMVLLGRKGVVNEILVGIGLSEKPVRFLGTETAIVIGLVYILLPFMVLAVGNALSQLDNSLEYASGDLGAKPAATFLYVTLPLSLPGVISGSIMVFTMAVSSYVTPALLSGGRVTVLSMLIFQQYSSVFDFHYGGALSVVLLMLTLVLVGIAGLVGNPRYRRMA